MFKVVPPIVWISCLVLALAIDWVFPINFEFLRMFFWLGVLLLILGMGSAIIVVRTFIRLKTEVHTFRKPSTLSTDGLFRFSRNPIYLGQTLALIGASILTANPVTFLSPLLFWSFCNFNCIPFEERGLEQIFGQDYRDYKLRVRRWI